MLASYLQQVMSDAKRRESLDPLQHSLEVLTSLPQPVRQPLDLTGRPEQVIDEALATDLFDRAMRAYALGMRLVLDASARPVGVERDYLPVSDFDNTVR